MQAPALHDTARNVTRGCGIMHEIAQKRARADVDDAAPFQTIDQQMRLRAFAAPGATQDGNRKFFLDFFFHAQELYMRSYSRMTIWAFICLTVSMMTDTTMRSAVPPVVSARMGNTPCTISGSTAMTPRNKAPATVMRERIFTT